MAGHAVNGAGAASEPHQARARSRAAAVSIASNTLLITLKIAAGVLTGSVAILTEVGRLPTPTRPLTAPQLRLRRADRDGVQPAGFV